MRLAILFCLLVALTCYVNGQPEETETEDTEKHVDNGGDPWRPQAPQYIRIHACKELPVVDNGVISSGGEYLQATRTVSCNPSFTLHGPNLIKCTKAGWTRPGHCKSTSNRYFLIKDKMTWYDAVVRCISLGSRLAMPKTITDNAVIIHLMRRLKANLAWIGLTRMNSNSNTWQWIDGSKLDADNYQGWLPGEPNMGLEGCAQFHILDQTKEDFEHPQLYGWNDFYCAHNRTRIGRYSYDVGAICERAGDVAPVNN